MATQKGLSPYGTSTHDALLERERELGMLDRLVQGALAGDAVVALLEGPPKVGPDA